MRVADQAPSIRLALLPGFKYFRVLPVLEYAMALTTERLERLRKKLADAKSYEDLMGKDGAIKDLLSSALTLCLHAADAPLRR